jgi:hypothetical protein
LVAAANIDAMRVAFGRSAATRAAYGLVGASAAYALGRGLLVDNLRTRAFDTFDRTFSRQQRNGGERGQNEDAYDDEDGAFDEERSDEEDADDGGYDEAEGKDEGDEDHEDHEEVESSRGGEDEQDRDQEDDEEYEGAEPEDESSRNGRGRARHDRDGRGRARDERDGRQSGSRHSRPPSAGRRRRDRRTGLSGIAAAALERGRVS